MSIKITTIFRYKIARADNLEMSSYCRLTNIGWRSLNICVKAQVLYSLCTNLFIVPFHATLTPPIGQNAKYNCSPRKCSIGMLHHKIPSFFFSH